MLKKSREKKNRNPYEMARKEWDFQINRSHRAGIFLRLFCVCLLGITIWSLYFTFEHIKKPALVPYVVTINQEGDVEFRGMVESHMITITDAAMRNYIIRFVSDLRNVSTDMVVLKKNLKDAYYISTSSAQRQITELITESNPFQMSQDKQRRDLRFQVFERISEETWRAEWVEEIRDNGVLTDTMLKTGTFSFIDQYPTNEIEAEMNPYGIYFTDFYITDKRYE